MSKTKTPRSRAWWIAWALLVVALGLALLLYWMLRRPNPKDTAAAFVAAVEQSNWNECESLIASGTDSAWRTLRPHLRPLSQEVSFAVGRIEEVSPLQWHVSIGVSRKKVPGDDGGPASSTDWLEQIQNRPREGWVTLVVVDTASGLRIDFDASVDLIAQETGMSREALLDLTIMYLRKGLEDAQRP